MPDIESAGEEVPHHHHQVRSAVEKLQNLLPDPVEDPRLLPRDAAVGTPRPGHKTRGGLDKAKQYESTCERNVFSCRATL